ncbi:MAG: FKBP-type peptidyl-prolyl cis-trans isomerase, partial [Flavobacteriales bacterium]|nr:FKBP-type peptidyl-prolyl cis-trans isomerase [Flavobacteriales bacterium]
GELIKSKDEVKYTKVVEGLDGKIIYRSITKSIVVDHQDEIKGMHEGLKLMSEGSEAIFIFPSHQAFGFHGDDNKIKSNTPLVYRVKVLKVNNNQINN